MAAAAAGMQLAGAVGSTIANVQSADATAKSLQSEARSIETQAEFDAQQQRRKNRLMLGQANAQAAASGVSLSSGSPLLLELDRVKQAEIETQSILRQGQIGAAGKRYSARLARRSIPYSILGGIMQAGSAGAKYGAGNAGNKSNA